MQDLFFFSWLHPEIIEKNNLLQMRKRSCLKEVVLCIKDVFMFFFFACTHSGQFVATKGSK